MSLLDALLHSWDRNNVILTNLLRALPEGGLDTRAMNEGRSVAQLFTHIHYVRLAFVSEDAPEFTRDVPAEEWIGERDPDRIEALLNDSARAVRDAVRSRIEARRDLDLHYDHPILLLQHMIWHEGYHHGQIKLALKLTGRPISDRDAGRVTWGVWMRKTERVPVEATASLHIGVLAHSADGSALCYLEMVRHAARLLGAHEHPEITLSLLPMGPTLEPYRRQDLAAVRAHLARSAQRLADAGCDFFACPDNTAHAALETPGPPLPLPGLHIADLVAQRARSEGRRRVGLLGTRWTMMGPVYPAAFARAGLEWRVPPPADREIVDDVIFGELCQGVLRDASRAQYVRIIEDLKHEGCDAVALSCTEIPLLVTPEVSPLPALDSTRLLAHAAVDVALGREPVPVWRGGPIV